MKQMYMYFRQHGRVILFFFSYTLLFWVLMRYLFFFLPFILGALFTFLLSPLCRKLQRKTGRSYKAIVSLTTAFALSLVFILFLGPLLLLIRELLLLFSKNRYFRFDELLPAVQQAISRILSHIPSLTKMFTAGTPSMLLPALSYAGSALKLLLSVPALLVFPAVTYSCTCFLLLKKQKIRRLFSVIFGPKNHLRLRHTIKAQAGHSSGLVFSYTLLYTITFAEACVILSLLQMPYPFVTALIVTVSDVFPILGPGAVLFPLCIYRLLCGAYLQTIGLFVGWLLITVLRQITEPRLISKITRTPGIIMLTAIYAAFISGRFWLIPYTALLFYLYRLFLDAKLLTAQSERHKKTRSQ